MCSNAGLLPFIKKLFFPSKHDFIKEKGPSLREFRNACLSHLFYVLSSPQAFSCISKESFFYEIGSSLPTSESWNRSVIFHTGHLWIFELHLSSRDCAISWQQLCRKMRISSPKSHPRRSQKWLGLAEEWLEKTKVTHQTNGTGQEPREIMEPSTSTVCIDHRGPLLPAPKPCSRQA